MANLDPAFTELISSLRDGRCLDDARRAITEVEEAVMEHGKPGTVTLTLTLRPASKGNRVMVSVTDAISIKKPVGEKEETILFRAGDGRFSRRDPRQPELPMRPVARDDVDQDTGEVKASG
jgi:hypothetical protein